MQKIDLISRRHMDRTELQATLEDWAGREDAVVRPMGRLVRPYKSKGGNMHWHITGLRKRMGTVEVTYDPSVSSLSVLVHDNRQGTWAVHAHESLARQLSKQSGMASHGQTE